MKGPYCDPNLKFNLVYKNNVSNSKFSDGQDFSNELFDWSMRFGNNFDQISKSKLV